MSDIDAEAHTAHWKMEKYSTILGSYYDGHAYARWVPVVHPLLAADRWKRVVWSWLSYWSSDGGMFPGSEVT